MPEYKEAFDIGAVSGISNLLSKNSIGQSRMSHIKTMVSIEGNVFPFSQLEMVLLSTPRHSAKVSWDLQHLYFSYIYFKFYI